MTQQQVQAIRVRGLEKSYELHVLRGVDFEVARDSIFALGSNGAGKTTAAKILSTRLRAAMWMKMMGGRIMGSALSDYPPLAFAYAFPPPSSAANSSYFAPHRL
ncbi:ABC-type branched-subunit amino acid transport system ATPase component [Aminobacter lissarensis]|uniref:ABC-type branched-subunit amino acid transport system ATPase component n=1 Tax=Aminobacter carboxidus TaxID=376165 RepID=A0A8E1WBH3_9HYPH|nr:ABC-type branched-subunit amino acid transport system ATPase component [Aminobacter lissarensis]